MFLLRNVDQTTQHEQWRYELPGPGGTIRFAVGSRLGVRSDVWRIWADKGKNDVYLGSRNHVSHLKISLHESGDWRFQLTSEEAQIQKLAPGRRVLDRWPRPPAHESGWTVGPIIWFPASDITIPGAADDHEETNWISRPKDEEIVAAFLVLLAPGFQSMKVPKQRPIAGFHLVSGEGVLLYTDTVPLTARRAQWLQEHRRSGALVDDAGKVIGSFHRVKPYYAGPDGTRMLWDLAAPTSPGPISSEQ